MPTQDNFRSDVTTNNQPRYTASRIVKLPEEDILLEEIPGSFGYDIDDNIEVHFYSAIGNALILSTVINLQDEILKIHTVKYQEPNDTYAYKNYVRIDFTKLFVDKNLILPSSDYRMVLNFFSNEIGSYTNRKLSVDEISSDRTEVQLYFNDAYDEVIKANNDQLLKELIEKSFNATDAIGITQKIFLSGVELNDPTEGVTADTIIANIPFTGQTYENTIDRIDNLGLLPEFKNELNNFTQYLYDFIADEIVIRVRDKNDQRIQESEFTEIITNIVQNKIASLRSTMPSQITVS
jgi:hypothetical protein